MDVSRALEKRRAYRSLKPAEITGEFMESLVSAATLMPSCYNNQPWRFVFAAGREKLVEMRSAINKGNEWAHAASLMAAVITRKELDCVIKEREYFLFDTGMATAAMILRATELGLVCHPIAGYSPEKTRAALGIPEAWTVAALLIIGKKDETLSPVLSDWQVRQESERPARRPAAAVYSVDKFSDRFEEPNPS